MSKIMIRQEIEISSSSKEEVEKLMKKMRTKGFHSSGEHSPYWSFFKGKFTIAMYTNLKKYKENEI